MYLDHLLIAASSPRNSMGSRMLPQVILTASTEMFLRMQVPIQSLPGVLCTLCGSAVARSTKTTSMFQTWLPTAAIMLLQRQQCPVCMTQGH